MVKKTWKLNLRGHMVIGEPANVLKVTWVVCDMDRWTWGMDNVFP
jgi:hypothetical protein